MERSLNLPGMIPGKCLTFFIFKMIQDMICREDFSFYSPICSCASPLESPMESPDVDAALQELYPSPNATESITTVRDTFDLVMSEERAPGVFAYNSNVFSFEFYSWVSTISQVAPILECDMHAVHHATTLFLKYLHREPKPMSTQAHWKALHWQRVACMWLALKYSDAEFEDITLLATIEREKAALIAAEIDVMRVVNYELAPPPDYLSLLGILLEVPAAVLDRARELLMTASAHPSKFYTTPYVVTCSACIVAARESLDGRPELYVDRIRELDIANTPFLLLLSERVLSL